MSISLRGGGCKPYISKYLNDNTNHSETPGMPDGFQSKIRGISAQIKQATLTSVDDKVTLMNCFQYFFYNERAFNLMVQYQELAKMNVDLLLEIVAVMMDCAKSFIKSNPLYCYYCMQITAWIWRALFWFYTRNEKRFLTAEEQQGFMDLLNSIDQQLGIESGNIYDNSIRYEMFVVKTIITIFPISSKEAKDLMETLTVEAIVSVATLSITDDLKNALKCGAIFLVNEGVKKYLKNQYHQIHSIETLKWHVINAIETSSESTTSLTKRLGQMYKSIQGSSWEIQYCWIKNIGNIIGVKLMVNEAEIGLDSDKIKQLKAENILVGINSGDYLINLDASKLNISESAKLLFDRVQSLRKLSELQTFLLKGSNQIPNFEHYNLKYVDQDTKSRNQISSSQYFVTKFRNLSFEYYIKRIEDTNEQITKVQSKVCDVNVKINTDSKQRAKDLEQLYQAREKIKELTTKLQNQNTFYIELSFIQQQWTKFVVQDVSYKDVKNEMFAQQILLTYYQMIQSLVDSNYLQEQIKLRTQNDSEPENKTKSSMPSNDDLQMIQELLNQQVTDLSNGDQISNIADQTLNLKLKLKTKEITSLEGFKILSVPNMEFAINQRLIQISAAFQIHQCNIQTLVKIKVCLRALINLIEDCQNNAESQDATHYIETIQYMLKVYVCELVMTCKRLPEELLELVNQINTTEMDKVNRHYNPPSDDVMKTFQIQYYDSININMPMTVLINIFAHFYKPIPTIDIHTISGKIQTLTCILDELIEFVADQEYIKKQFVAFMKSITLMDCSIYTEQVESWKKINKTIQSIAENPQLSNIVALQTEITNRQETTQQDYQKMLTFNPYDQLVTEQFEFEQNTLNDIQKLIKLVIEMMKRQRANGDVYINNLMSKMMMISERQQQKAQSIDSTDNSQPTFSPLTLLKEYQSCLYDFQQLIKAIQQNLQFMSNEILIVQEIHLACSGVEECQDWLTEIQNYDTEQFKKFCNFTIQNCLVNTDQLFRVDTQLQSEIMQIIQPAVQNPQSYTDQLVEIIQTDKWKIRECTVFQLLKVSDCCLKIESKQCADIIILRMKIYETNKQVRTLLNHPSNLQQMNQVLQQYWPSQQEVVVSEIKGGLKVLNSLLYELQQEQDAEKRKKLQIEYQQKENEIQEQLSNVQEVGNALGITMLFIQDLKKDLAKIDQKINEIQENLSNMNADLQFLRGKTVYQLIDIRRSTILRNKKILDIKSIYIKIRCVEKKFQVEDDEGKRKEIKYDQATYLYNTEPTDNEGEINEFLYEDKKTMLIHGPAGSGKSTASRKIEEYFWELYEKTPSQEVRLVPIVIQLPSIQDPLHSALQETLKSDSYKFDVNQIRELKDEIDKQKLKLLIIMDSYDELHQDYIGTNLIRTNKLSGWGHKNINHYPKVLVTTRSEVLNKSDYHEWFLAEGSNDVKFYKEVRLERFDKEQRDTYIDCYLNLSVKKVVTESYLLMANTQNELQTFENFIQLWNQIKLEFTKTKEDHLLTDQQIQYIVAQLVKDEHIQIQNAELKRNLRVVLQELKSGHFYKNTIQLINIEHILETPFMMEIVVQVLPTLIKQKSQPEFVKPHFIDKFTQILNKQNPDNIDTNYNKAADAWNELTKDQTFMEDFSITMNQNKIKQKIVQVVKQPATTMQAIQVKQLHQHYVESLMSQKLTQYDFYNSFFELYFEKQIGKLKEQGMAFDYVSLTKELWKFAKNLAVQLSSQTKTQVEYKAQGLLYKKETKSWEDEFFDDDCKEGPYKKMFRSCIPIKQQTNTFSFNHKSLQEFLVAKDFLDNMEQIITQVKQLQLRDNDYLNFCKQELINHFRNHFINQKSWSVDFMKGVCTFVSQKVQYMQVIKDLMFYAVELTKFQDLKLIMLGSNCLFMLQRMGESFMDRDISGINLQDIDLSAANFAYCNLDRSIMNNVNIAGINVFQASLREVKWTNIYVSQLPPKEYKMEIMKLHYSTQSKLIMISENQISNEDGEPIEVCNQTIKNTLCWRGQEQDYLFVQYDRHIAQYDLNKCRKIGEVQLNHKINKMRCNRNHLFILLDNSDIITLKLMDITQQRKLDVKVKIQELQTDKTEIKITNIWPAKESNEMAVHSNELYGIQMNEISKTIKAKRILQITEQSTLKYSCKLKLALVNKQKLIQLEKEPKIESDLDNEAKLIYLHHNHKEVLLFSKVDMQLFNVNTLKKKKFISHNLDRMTGKSLSQNNEMLITLHEQKVGIWNIKSFEQIQILSHVATCCTMDKQMKVLALGNETELQYQDLKSLTSQKQLNFRDVKFARNSQNFLGMTTDNELYYFNVQNQNEVKWNLLMKFNEMVYIFFSLNGTRALVSLQTEKQFITFDCLKGKKAESFGFCKSYVIERENEDIMFIKGTQLYMCYQKDETTKDVATIVSPIKKSKEVNNITYFKIDGKVICVTVDGKYFRYKLSKYTQFEIEETNHGNVTNTLMIGGKQLYIIDNKCVIDEGGEVLYRSFSVILDYCTTNDNCLIVLHEKHIRLLYFDKSEKEQSMIRQQSIKVNKISKIIATSNCILTVADDTLIMYSIETLKVIDKILLNGKVNKMALLCDNLVGIATQNPTVYVWDSDSFKVLSVLVGHKDPVVDLSFNPETETLVTRSVNNFLIDYSIGRQCCEQMYHCQLDKDQQKFKQSQIINNGQKSYIYWIHNNCIFRESLSSQFRGNTHMVVNLQNEYYTPTIFVVNPSTVILGDSENRLWISTDQCQTYTQFCDRVLEPDWKYNQLSISTDEQYLLTAANSFETCIIWSIKDKQQKLKLDFNQIIKAHFLDQGDILVQSQNNGIELYTFNIETKIKSKVAVLKNDVISAYANLNGFSIAHMDSSIDVYARKRCLNYQIDRQYQPIQDTGKYFERYVRVSVFNNSSNQPIQSYETDCRQAYIQSHINLSLVELFHQPQDQKDAKAREKSKKKKKD